MGTPDDTVITMDVSDITLGGVATTVGYLLVGGVVTAALAVGLLWATRPLGTAVYRAFYLAVDPWSATTAASVLTFVAAALLASGGVTVGTATVLDRFDATLAGGVAGLGVGGLVLVAAVVFAGVAGLLAALLATGAFVVGTGFLLRRTGAQGHSYAAFTGGLPALVVLLLLLGFGLGWGGGYDVVAEEVPPSAVEGPAAEFPDAQLRDDLLSPDQGQAYCETESDRRVCRLPLRGYAHEERAARFLARHGVRCHYLNDGADAGRESFMAVDGDTYYRISCRAYGD